MTTADLATRRVTPLHLERIHPHPANVRDDLGDLTELAASIRAMGLVQPITVRPMPDRPGHYEILSGHRRYAATRQAGHDTIQAIVRPDLAADLRSDLSLMLVENVHRADLTPMEKAEAIESLVHRGMTNAEISAATGLAVSTVGHLRSLLLLTDESREQVRAGRVTATAAAAAVRQVRQTARVRDGKRKPGVTLEPDHLTAGHPLAHAAAERCATADHGARRRIGRIACGQCWEAVIRADARGGTE